LTNRNIHKIIPFAIEKLNLKQKYKSIPYQMMIYGLVRERLMLSKPNLGKSSIINSLKLNQKLLHKSLAKKGSQPGERKV
jgi:ribosome biogenesis GTPase A